MIPTAQPVWNHDLWQPLHIQPDTADRIERPSRVGSFFDYQEPAETYEIRGILPRTEITTPLNFI